MIEHLIDGACLLCVLILGGGGVLLFCGGLVALFMHEPNQPPRPACRDWRDNARGRRQCPR